jgi:hypothetical protein
MKLGVTRKGKVGGFTKNKNKNKNKNKKKISRE